MYDWNRDKALANFEKHGVSFFEAAGAFDDPKGLDAADEAHSWHESDGFALLRAEAVDCWSSRTRCAEPTFGSSAPDGRTVRSVRAMPKRKIDYSDIPALSDEQLRRMKRVGRPPIGRSPRKAVSLRLDPDVLDRLKAKAAKRGLPYQSLINDILARAVGRAT
jgi:uncharacterized protein (DUF4415 family)